MKAHGSEVGVFVRIRPSAHVAQGLIECLPDGQVSKTLLSSAGTELNPCSSQILAFKDVCFCLFEVKNEPLSQLYFNLSSPNANHLGNVVLGIY